MCLSIMTKNDIGILSVSEVRKYSSDSLVWSISGQYSHLIVPENTTFGGIGGIGMKHLAKID